MDKEYFRKKFSFICRQFSELKLYTREHLKKAIIILMGLMVLNSTICVTGMLVICKDIKSLENKLQITNSINLRK